MHCVLWRITSFMPPKIAVVPLRPVFSEATS